MNRKFNIWVAAPSSKGSAHEYEERPPLREPADSPRPHRRAHSSGADATLMEAAATRVERMMIPEDRDDSQQNGYDSDQGRTQRAVKSPGKTGRDLDDDQSSADEKRRSGEGAPAAGKS